MTRECILEVFYANAHGRRYILSENSFWALYSMGSPSHAREFCDKNFIEDKNGHRMHINISSGAGVHAFRLYVRDKPSNPLESDEVYDNPLN
jgi:hypothetical protein